MDYSIKRRNMSLFNYRIYNYNNNTNNYYYRLLSITAVVLLLVAFVDCVPADRRGDDSSCNCVCGVRGRENRIVGGKESAVHEFPWLAGLFRQGKLYCGASLITNQHLITAAHCVNGMEASEIRVLLGGHNISKDYVEQRRVRAIMAHEDFDIFTFNNDIAILKMERPIKFRTSIQPACLPDGSELDFAGRLTVVAGWGRTDEKRPPSETLRSVIVPVWEQEQCLEAGYGKKRISNNMMCAGFHDGKRDACQGDSGGPMHMEGPTGSMELIGVVSWGRGCARPNLPGIYTRVVNYLPWIKQQLGAQCMCAKRKGDRNNFLEKIMSRNYY